MVGGVGDGQKALPTQPVHEQIVEHPALLIAEQGVLGAALGEPTDVA